MAAFRRLGEFLGLTVEEDREEEYETFETPTVEPVRERVVELAERREYRPEPSVRAVVPPTPVSAPAASTSASRIIMVAPHNFNDASQIGDEVRRGHAVLMNLLECDEALARRLVDYASGLTHGIDGKISRVSRGVFMISPKNVDVDELASASVETPNFFNQS